MHIRKETAIRLEDNPVHRGMRKNSSMNSGRKKIFSEKILEVMNRVPRHLFVPRGFDEWAYKDIAFPSEAIKPSASRIPSPIKLNYSMSSRVIKYWKSVQAVAIRLLSLRSWEPKSIRWKDKRLFITRQLHFKRMGYLSIRCYLKDGFDGLPKYGPYDKIIITWS